MPPGIIPAPMISATQLPALSLDGKPISRARAVDANRHFGDHAKKSFGACHHAHQIVARRIEMLATKTDDLAIHQNHFDAEQVVGGQTVFEAMHPAGILRHVAADGACNLAGRIGRIIEPVGLHGMGNGKIGDPGLRSDAPVCIVDVEDPVELAETEGNAVFERQSASGQRCPRPTRHDLYAFAVTVFQNIGYLPHVFGQHDDHRKLAVGRQPVAFIRAKLFLFGDDAFARDDPAQCLDDFPAPGKNIAVGIGHAHEKLRFLCPAVYPRARKTKTWTNKNRAGQARSKSRIEPAMV
jgi:hypothetical protein